MNDLFVKTLPNGLRVLIQESHTAPVATFWVWYRVGSRNEPPGRTGISHWVEHMLFKGTPTHPTGTLTRLVDRLGGRWNAFTWKDYTAYFEVLPVEHIEVALRLEADRMHETRFDPDVVSSERTVIISEREGAENYPAYLLNEEVEALAFRLHPYRHPVIGWKDDLRSITREDLCGYYRAHYHPSNALVVAVGDFETARMAAMIEEAFGPLAPGELPPAVRSHEPAQEGERRVVLRRPGGATSYLQMAHRVPGAAHRDLAALMVLDGMLSGFKGVSAFEGASGVRTSRLYQALVDRGLATEASSAIVPSIDPTLFRINVTVRAGVPPAEVEEAVRVELSRLCDSPPEEDELARVRRQAQAAYVYLRDGVARLALGLGALAAVDRPAAFQELEPRIAAVTGAEVSAAATTYLTERGRTVGWYLPEEGAPPRHAPYAGAEER